MDNRTQLGQGHNAAPAQDSDNPSLEASATMRLIAAGAAARQQFEAELAGLGLTMRHLGALGHLHHSSELSYSDLARRARVTAPSMHATVRQLEDLGAVRRELAGHGHTARLEVTDTGRQLLMAARAAARRLDADLATRLGAAAVTTLAGLLGELTVREKR